MVTTRPMELLRRPRTALAAAAQPGAGTGAPLVVLCALLSLGLNLAATLLGAPALRSSGIALDVTVAVLTIAFWWAGSWLMDAAARSMGATSNRRACRATTAWGYPLMSALAAFGLVETLLAAGGSAAAAAALGWIALPLLAAFVAVTVIAVAAAYGLPFLNAFAVALLPFAAVAALMLVLGLAAGIAASA